MRQHTMRVSDPSTPGGFFTINETDFDPALHQRFGEVTGPRLDGPTFEEFVAKGYKPEGYPPSGYAERPSPGLDAYRASLKDAPPAIAELNVEKAKELVAGADTDLLVVLETAEKAHAKFSGGRQGVLEAIAARRKVLAESK